MSERRVPKRQATFWNQHWAAKDGATTRQRAIVRVLQVMLSLSVLNSESLNGIAAEQAQLAVYDRENPIGRQLSRSYLR